ncbi:histidine phosphatase family protein [Streptomyces tsukubensis]|uniref:Histidine phosphatase family protein n=1 Tax=Streptomyces tsukubensis TaxID=83656 RepID=A0A1V4A225_9ACTN|nr:histidine phosphatase family protein [Streptomyces tsukubensis]OON72457.1 hypothetical protein B1H18_29795 [Streptomyces tsukubensis]QFR96957.1 histidine phosphatase family protein [Streptomyces tsukubensis]
MTVRVTLISPATSAATVRAGFADDDDPLTRAGRQAAARAADAVKGVGPALVSPVPRCRETAAELGLDATPTSELSGQSFGRWRGRSLAAVGEEDPAGVAAWLGDPHYAPPGGESLAALHERIEGWLRGLTAAAMGVTAVVEPEVVRSAVVAALELPMAAFWRLDVRPLAVTELSGRSGRWNLRTGRSLSD